eukprot:scaffold197725_cov27-Tisochrysis_lutea.AAC.2
MFSVSERLSRILRRLRRATSFKLPIAGACITEGESLPLSMRRAAPLGPEPLSARLTVFDTSNRHWLEIIYSHRPQFIYRPYGRGCRRRRTI